MPVEVCHMEGSAILAIYHDADRKAEVRTPSWQFMAIYFLLIDAERFSGEIVPALAASWRERIFAPCRPLCQSLHPTAAAFGKQYYLGSGELMLDAVLRGAAFNRVFWRALAGEILWFAAADVPETLTALETLLPLLGYPSEISLAREKLV